jgi:hypothetical protein
MRILIALGGNALLRRSDPMTTEVQRRNIMVAARARTCSSWLPTWTASMSTGARRSRNG